MRKTDSYVSVKSEPMQWTGMGCDVCGFGTVEDCDRFDPHKPCPDCGAVMEPPEKPWEIEAPELAPAVEPRPLVDHRCECTHGSPERRCGDEALYVVTREDGSLLQVCGNCTFASDQQRSPIVAEAEPPAERCERCGWPLAASIEEGCTRGNCSMRCTCPGAHLDSCPLKRAPEPAQPGRIIGTTIDVGGIIAAAEREVAEANAQGRTPIVLALHVILLGKVLTATEQQAACNVAGLQDALRKTRAHFDTDPPHCWYCGNWNGSDADGHEPDCIAAEVEALAPGKPEERG
jgi:hypothetical protein